MAEQPIIALVTGANRGIGLETVRQLAALGMTVILGARDAAKGAAAAQGLGDLQGKVLPRPLDVTDDGSVASLAQAVEQEFGRLDVLVNNAGILYDSWQHAATADLKTVHEAFETNLFGAWRVAEAFVPLVKKSRAGRIVNVSSEAGSLAAMGAGSPPGYSASKAALNAFTRTLAAELQSDKILVNAVCPGWTATDMGGGGRPVPEGAASVVWAATLPDDGPTGGFFRDGKPLAW